MDVIILFNGLGNQMSQYAFYLHKKRKDKSTRFIFSRKSHQIHNGYELGRVFGIRYADSLLNKCLYFIFAMAGYKRFTLLSTPVRWVLHTIGIRIIEENDDYNFKPEYLIPSRGLTFYSGGWHSEKYFVDVADLVRSSFQFKLEDVDRKNLEILERIQSGHSISVHVRRGDFLDANNINTLGAVCTLNYFLVAIEKMRSLIDHPHFYFFTNDPDWVKANFNGPDYTLIDVNTKGDSWKDMFLISRCSHHICSNGSFSWWSAWLNPHPHPLVIVPKYFTANKEFTDIYPPEWIQLTDY